MKLFEVFGCLKKTLEINSQPDEENQLNNRSVKSSINNLTNGSYTNLNNQELKQQVSIVQKLANSTGCLNKNFQKTKEKKKKSSTALKMTTNVESTNKKLNENCDLSIQYSKKQNDLYAKTAGFIVGSSIYGQLLVVICLTLFTAEICTSLPLHYFEVFYLYLYSVSILFLLYVFFYLLRGVRVNELKRREQKFKKEKISEFEKSYCSIFLRIGAVIFGLSSMVYNGLEFVSFFEIPFSSQCYSVILLINPVLQATFTFAQMYLIFTYSRLMIHKFKLIARIGLMHLIGTNICVWIRILVKETLQELKSSTLHSTLEESILLLKSNFKQKLNDTFMPVNKTNPCGKDNIMGNTLNEFFEFGVLFIVEYSLIGAAFFYVMWSNTNSRSNLYIYNQSKKHISQFINNQTIKNQSNQETNNVIERSGTISPSLSMNHLNNSITNGILFKNTNNIETSLNHALVDTNSSSCSPTNQTTNSILPSSPQNPNLVTSIECTPPANRNVLMINTHQLTSNYGQSNCSSNNMNVANTNNSNVLLLDNLSVSSRESLNEKYQQFSPYKLNSMYNNNLMMMNSTQSLYSCLGSSKGLFCGFLSLVISITSLIIFFVLVHHTNYHLLATLISDISHSILLVLSIISSIVAYFKIKKLKFQRGIPETADGRLRDLLLKVAAFGLYIYAFFGVIAGSLELNSLQNIAVLTTSTLTIIQVTLQSLLISDVVCRKRSSAKQPGRQLITFLLIINLTLWVIYTFEMQKIEASPVQLKVFGFTTWALIVRITLPLSIFYRFHCAITFAEIWKNSYK